MTETDQEFQRPDSWDWNNAEAREGIKRPRVVVSVAFRRPEFERVAAYAERLGKRTSQFIREATLQSVPQAERRPVVLRATDLRASTTARSTTVNTENVTATSLALAAL